MTMERPVLTGFFGKIPAKGDFVGRGLPASFQRPWEEWATEALRQSRAVLGEAWEEAWMVAPVWRFCLPGGACGPDAVSGLVLPSIDRVGRAWPLVVAFVFQGEAEAPDPAPYETLLHHAEAAAREAIAEDIQPDAFAARLQDLALPDFVPLPQQDALWWTEGGPNVASQSLTLPGLPSMPEFAALLAGERG